MESEIKDNTSDQQKNRILFKPFPNFCLDMEMRLNVILSHSINEDYITRELFPIVLEQPTQRLSGPVSTRV